MQTRSLAIAAALSVATGCAVDAGESSIRTDYAGAYAEARFEGDVLTSELRSGADDRLLATLRVSGDDVTWSNATGEETGVELAAWELPDDELTANDTLYRISGAMLAIDGEPVDTDSPYYSACVGANTGYGICYICTFGCSVMQCCFDPLTNFLDCFNYNACVQDGGTWS